MTEANTQSSSPEPNGPGKGKAFFERAEQVAETGNWDFAIEMYIEGIKREIGNVEEGYQPLRDVSMKRAAQRGKKPSMGEKFKYRMGKDPEVNLINSAFLLAKEPGSLQLMNQVRQAALKLELNTVLKWVCDILLESQRLADADGKKPNIKLLKMLTADYAAIDEYLPAMQACEIALKVMPDDAEFQQTRGDLSAKYTMHKGKYGDEGKFTDKVVDIKGQQELARRDEFTQSEDFLLKDIEKAKVDYLESPNMPGKINSYVDTLLKMHDEAYEGEAVDILTKAHNDSGAYQYKLKIGEIKIRQMTRRYRSLVQAGDKEGAKKQLQAQLAFELEEYKERSINYPTDLKIKYELGYRQFLGGQYDDAIASLQQAQRDPRRHLAAMSSLGRAFEAKGWMREASETYARALDAEMSEEKAKDLRYNLGSVLEKMGKLSEAREQFSAVAQADYNFKDVRQRLDAVNKAIDNPPQTPPSPTQE